MSDDNTQGVNEPSPASDGSQPVAWWVTLPGRDFPYLSHIYGRAIFCHNDEPGSEVIPLYRSPTLTDEEKTAIALAKSRLGTSDGDWQADDVLAALLERIG